MKIHVFISALCMIAFFKLSGQEVRSLSKIDVEDILTEKGTIKGSDKVNFDSTFILKNLKKILSLSNADSFQIKRWRIDEQNQTTTIRLTQLHKSIKIFNSEIILHFDRNKVLISVVGNWYENLNLHTKATVSSKTALKVALKNTDTLKLLFKYPDIIQRHKANMSDLIPVPRICYYWDRDERIFVLAWEINEYIVTGESYKIFIDANIGGILKKIPLYNNCSTGMVATSWYGNKTIWTWLDGSVYKLRDDCNTTPSYDNYTYNMQQGSTPNGVFYTSPNNIWDISPMEKVGGTLHWCMDQFEQYLRNQHSRASWNGVNGNWIGYGNALVNTSQGLNSNNAAFIDLGSNTGYTVFGYGSSTTSPTDDWNTLDMVAHEFTHGIDYSEANLIYQGESGALDESFADIFGEIAENYVLGSNDWLVADAITGMGPLRSFSNPKSISSLFLPMPNTYLGANSWYTGPDDNGGVHHNSSVQNFMFYLLCQGGTGINDKGNSYSVTGIGINNARKVAYRALVDKVTSNSTFPSARIAWESAVDQEFPGNSAYSCAVKDAWYAVGVGTTCSAVSVPDLDITNATLPLGNSYCVGSQVSVTCTIDNICSGSVNSATNTGVFLMSQCPTNSYPSFNSVLDDNTLTVSEMSNNTETENLSFTIPSGTSPGSYFVVIVTDYENAISGECLESNNFYCIPITINATNNWTGAVSTAWENPANWSCGSVADANTNVIINSGTVIVNSNGICKTLKVKPGVTFRVNPGFNLNVLQ